MINIELMTKLYMVIAHNLKQGKKSQRWEKEREKHKRTSEIKNRRQHTC